MEVKNSRIGAYGIIIKNDKIALVRKAGGGYKGKLDLPGGGIEHAETPLETLKRELKEEINGTVVSAKLIDVTSANIKWEMKSDLYENLHHIGILYLTEIKEDNLKADSDGLDSEGANWYLISDLKEDMVSPFTWYSLKELGFK